MNLISKIPVVLFIIISLHAQGQFRGKIIDAKDGKPLPYAVIEVVSEKLVILSGEGGRFEIEYLESDSLKVTINFLGYKSTTEVIYIDRFNIISLSPDYQDIGEVVISTTLFNTSLKSSAGSINLISPAIIETNRTTTIRDIINQSPGVFMADGTLSTNRLIVRGIGSRNPYGTNKIRIYLDDIPLTLVDGTSSPGNINPSILERIEILKGPSSAVYGAGLGGTLLMKTETPAKKGLSGDIQGAVSSWRGIIAEADISMKKEKTTFKLSGRKTNTDGYRENSEYDRNDLFFNTSWRGEKLNVGLLLNYLDFRGGIPSSLNEKDYHESPGKAADSWASVNGFEDFKNFTGGLSLEYFFSNRFMAKTVLFSNYGELYESRPFNIFDSKQYSLGVRQTFDYLITNIDVKAGFEVISENTDWQIFETNSGEQGERLNSLKDQRSYFSGFIHSEIDIFPRLKLEPGVSITFLNYRLTDLFENEEDVSGNYRYDPEISPRIGTNYRIGEETYIYASAGHGFSPPSLEETLLPEGEANTALKPESGWTFDGGLRGSRMDRRFFYDFGLYYIKLRDLLLTKRLSPDRFVGVNAGRTNHYGAELFLRYRLFDPVQSSGNSLIYSSSYTYSDNYFIDFVDDGIDYSGNELPGIPFFIMNHFLNYEWKKKFSVWMNYRYTGKQFMNDANTEIYKGHHLVNFRIAMNQITISEKIKLKLFFRINNLFNYKYASMILVNAPSFGGSDPRYYYPGNPRNFRAGIGLSFN